MGTHLQKRPRCDRESPAKSHQAGSSPATSPVPRSTPSTEVAFYALQKTERRHDNDLSDLDWPRESENRSVTGAGYRRAYPRSQFKIKEDKGKDSHAPDLVLLPGDSQLEQPI